ncbi:MAG: methylmalonic aciduria and homocystinuria type D protein [Thermosynechococcaceae cyanobacterium]
MGGLQESKDVKNEIRAYAENKIYRSNPMGMEYSTHLPSDFITQHVTELLPEWPVPVRSVLIVMQHCPVPLVERNADTEDYKRQLRQQFIEFGHQIAGRLHTLGHRTEIFDPKTGQPLLSQPGSMTLNDVAVVQAVLGYPLFQTEEGCWILEHPRWGTAVFPAVLMSSAEPGVVDAIATQITHPVLASADDRDWHIVPLSPSADHGYQTL